LTAPEAIAGLRPELAARLSAEMVGVLPVRATIDSADGHTRKVLLGLADGAAIETVLMYFRGRATVCISTQVGCAMGCVFCATGQMGFRRHLSPGEIAAQVVHAERALRARGETLRNIVLMGMGEPLHNYEATMAALETVMDHRGLAIGPRFITLSTVGVVPGIRRLTAERRPMRLAVSLHGATDEERARLVPPARRWPLSELMAACRDYTTTLGRRISCLPSSPLTNPFNSISTASPFFFTHEMALPRIITRSDDKSPKPSPTRKQSFASILASFGSFMMSRTIMSTG